MTDYEVLTELRGLKAKLEGGGGEATAEQQRALREAIGVFEDSAKVPVPGKTTLRKLHPAIEPLREYYEQADADEGGVRRIVKGGC